MAKDANCCENCFFSEESGDPESVACLRFPPVLFEEDEVGRYTSQFPYTKRNWWCGEHKLDTAKFNLNTAIPRTTQ